MIQNTNGWNHVIRNDPKVPNFVSVKKPEQPILPEHQLQFKIGEFKGRVEFEASSALATGFIGKGINAMKVAVEVKEVTQVETILEDSLSTVPKTDFYVTPKGDVIPATRRL